MTEQEFFNIANKTKIQLMIETLGSFLDETVLPEEEKTEMYVKLHKWKDMIMEQIEVDGKPITPKKKKLSTVAQKKNWIKHHWGLFVCVGLKHVYHIPDKLLDELAKRAIMDGLYSPKSIHGDVAASLGRHFKQICKEEGWIPGRIDERYTEGIDLDGLQQEIFDNKKRRGFNTTCVLKEIALLAEELGELAEAYKEEQQVHHDADKISEHAEPRDVQALDDRFAAARLKQVDAYGDLIVLCLGGLKILETSAQKTIEDIVENNKTRTHKSFL